MLLYTLVIQFFFVRIIRTDDFWKMALSGSSKST